MCRAICWPEGSIEYIKSIQDKMNKEIATIVNEKYGLAIKARNISALRCRYNFRSKNNGRFKKGDIPWTKGRKGEWTGNSTSFKKGNIPWCTEPLGTEVLKEGRYYVKVSDASGAHNIAKRWQLRSRLVWEQHNNQKIPDGHVVIHLDGDSTNDSPNNLMLVDKSITAIINRQLKLTNDAEINKTIILTAKLIRKSNKIRGEKNGKI